MELFQKSHSCYSCEYNEGSMCVFDAEARPLPDCKYCDCYRATKKVFITYTEMPEIKSYASLVSSNRLRRL